VVGVVSVGGVLVVDSVVGSVVSGGVVVSGGAVVGSGLLGHSNISAATHPIEHCVVRTDRLNGHQRTTADNASKICAAIRRRSVRKQTHAVASKLATCQSNQKHQNRD
jgi:hypothetical protein